jgi:raffinose/stachyose/melibiose transport system substrate-binding protein
MKKALTLIIVSILFAGLLAGCNAGGSSSSGDAGGGDGDKVELKVFIGQPRFKEQYETYSL